MAGRPGANPILVTVVAVFAFVAWFLYPPVEGEEKGRVLALIEWQDGVAGDARMRLFTVADDYERLTLSYNITIGFHVRANLTGPDGATHEARAIDRAGEEKDELELEVTRPQQGDWWFTAYILPGGYLEKGNFTILGFGGSRAGP